MNEKCICCGRLLSERDLESRICRYCGMFVFNLDDPAKAMAVAGIAKAYKDLVIRNITDISLVSPDGEKRLRICDAADCFEKIIWSRTLSPAFLSKEYWHPVIDLRLNVSGKERRLLLPNEEYEGDRKRKLGVAIDRTLSLYTYFGTEAFHISNGPYDLKI